jgi:hypothetical protein
MTDTPAPASDESQAVVRMAAIARVNGFYHSVSTRWAACVCTDGLHRDVDNMPARDRADAERLAPRMTLPDEPLAHIATWTDWYGHTTRRTA